MHNNTEAAELFELWVRGRRSEHPDPKHCRHTLDQPFTTEYIGSTVGGQNVYAYGVRERRIGLTGPHLSAETYYEWHWFSDEDEARREGLLFLWKDGPECAEKIARLNAERPEGRYFPSDLTAVITMIIATVAGKALEAYIIFNLRGFFWEVTRDRRRVQEIRRENWWEHSYPWGPKGLLEAPSFQDKPGTPIPPVYQFHYGTCPETGEKWYRYGAFVRPSGFFPRKVYVLWYADQAEAERVHADAVELIEGSREWHVREQDQKLRQEMYKEIRLAASQLKDSSSYRCLSSLAPADVLETFNELQDRPWEEKPEETDELYLYLGQLEAVTKQLAAALKGVYETTLDERRQLLSRLALVLGIHYRTCPFCETKWVPTQTWAEDLVVYGEAFLPCQCPEKGWQKHDETRPGLVREMQTVLAGHLHEVRVKTHLRVETYRDSHGVVLSEVRDESRLVAECLSVDYRPALRVSLSGLAALSTNESGELQDVWSETKRSMEAKEQETAKKEVAKGRAVKCRFSYDESREQWSARIRAGNVTTVYAVVKESKFPIEADRIYYCWLRGSPPKSQRENFVFTLVQPFLEAR